MNAICYDIGHETRIELLARGRGPAVFLLHGIGGNHRQWAAQTRALQDRYAVLAWNARGYGNSTGPKVQTMRDFAQDFMRLLDALELDRVIAVGHSMGGRILMEVCAIAPERLAAMALSGAQASYLTHMTLAQQQDYLTSRQSLFDDTGTVPDENARKVSRQVLPDTVAPSVRDGFVRDLQKLNKAGYLAAIAASVGWDRSAVLPTLTMPVCVFGGALDTVCPPQESERIATLIGQGAATILDEVGHMGQLEAPQRTTDILARFLDAHAHLASTLETGAIPSETP